MKRPALALGTLAVLWLALAPQANAGAECAADKDCALTDWTPDCCTRCEPFAKTKAAAAAADARCAGKSAGPPRCPSLSCPNVPPAVARCVSGQCVLGH